MLTLLTLLGSVTFTYGATNLATTKNPVSASINNNDIATSQLHPMDQPIPYKPSVQFPSDFAEKYLQTGDIKPQVPATVITTDPYDTIPVAGKDMVITPVVLSSIYSTTNTPNGVVTSYGKAPTSNTPATSMNPSGSQSQYNNNNNNVNNNGNNVGGANGMNTGTNPNVMNAGTNSVNSNNQGSTGYYINGNQPPASSSNNNLPLMPVSNANTNPNTIQPSNSPSEYSSVSPLTQGQTYASPTNSNTTPDSSTYSSPSEMPSANTYSTTTSTPPSPHKSPKKCRRKKPNRMH